MFILCCLLLSGAHQAPQRTPPAPEFPPEIILPLEKDDLLLWAPNDSDVQVPESEHPDWEDFTNPFFPSTLPLNLRRMDHQPR